MQEQIATHKTANKEKWKDHRIYLDNAATTPMSPEVLDAMLPYMSTHFGNPSSIYSYGRETRLAIENSRKSVAKILGVKPGTIFLPAEAQKVIIQPLCRYPRPWLQAYHYITY